MAPHTQAEKWKKKIRVDAVTVGEFTNDKQMQTFQNLTPNLPPKYKDLDRSAARRREKLFLLHFIFFFSVVIKCLS